MTDEWGDEKLGAAFGANLRAMRERWGLSLREVQERSEDIARRWGHKEYSISASWLNRMEAGNPAITAPKLIALTAIFGLSAEEMLALCAPPKHDLLALSPASLPNATLLLTPGPFEAQAREALPDELVTAEPPEESHLMERPENCPSHFRRGVVGRKDNTMEPMIRPGSIVLIDTQRKAIAKRRDWTHEFNRPIYFLLTRDSYFTSFCELDANSEWLTLVPHALSYQTNRRFRYRREVEVVGEVTAFISRRA